MVLHQPESGHGMLPVVLHEGWEGRGMRDLVIVCGLQLSTELLVSVSVLTGIELYSGANRAFRAFVGEFLGQPL